MNEIWKNIDGYGDNYQVSNKGRVRSIDRFVSHGRHGKIFRKGKIRKLMTTKHGYYQVSLKYDGKTSTQLVHRLLAIAFIDNPDNNPCINHKDGVKSDNNISNLEWCTYSENIIHAIDLGLNEKASGENAQNNMRVVQFDFCGNRISEYYSATKASECTGIGRSNICRAAREHKIAGGCIWMYETKLREMSKREFEICIQKINESSYVFTNDKKKILKLDFDGNILDEYESLSSAGESMNLDISTISKVARGKRRSSGGYVWMFAESYKSSIS